MPNDKLTLDYNDPEAIPGVICKTASVSPLEVTDADLKKINKYTLSPVSADDVFIFKASIADNEQDDRNYMPFNLKSLQDLKKLYPGKTMLKDHRRMADNQIARIYDTELVQDANKQTDLGELHTELIAKIYMIKTDSNKDLIAEIMGGIKKEVSTSTVPSKMICNICGTDNMKDYCRHWPGIEYTVEDGSGTHKSIGFSKPIKDPEIDTKNTENELKNKEMDARLLAQRVKNAESFFNVEKESEK